MGFSGQLVLSGGNSVILMMDCSEESSRRSGLRLKMGLVGCSARPSVIISLTRHERVTSSHSSEPLLVPGSQALLRRRRAAGGEGLEEGGARRKTLAPRWRILLKWLAALPTPRAR